MKSRKYYILETRYIEDYNRAGQLVHSEWQANGVYLTKSKAIKILKKFDMSGYDARIACMSNPTFDEDDGSPVLSHVRMIERA